MHKIKKIGANYFGVALAELLVSMVINSIIILILFTIYILVKKQSSKIEQKVNLLYNKTIVDFFLRNKIRKSGYKGFASKVSIQQYSNVPSFSQFNIIPKAPIAVCKATIVNDCKKFVTSNILQKIIAQKIKPFSDILIVYDIPDYVAYLSQDMRYSNDPLETYNSKNLNDSVLNVGDYLIIADLQHINRFILSRSKNNLLFHETPLNNSNHLAKKFPKGSEIFRVKNIAFYVANNQNNNVQATYSLYMEDLNGHSKPQAIVDGVNNLFIQVFNPDQQNKLSQASDFGWIYQRYIIINLNFINKEGTTVDNFITGMEINNNL